MNEQAIEYFGDDLDKKCMKFCDPKNPDYGNKDQNFINFIAKDLPNVLEYWEAYMNKTGKKYLVGDSMTMADILFASFLMKLPYNPRYENQHIVEAVIRKYPKLMALSEDLLVKFDFVV